MNGKDRMCHYRPEAHYAWYSNPLHTISGLENKPQGKPDSTYFSDRTLDALFRGFMRMYVVVSGRDSAQDDITIDEIIYKVFAAAKYAVGSGKNAKGDLIYQDDITKFSSAKFLNELALGKQVN